jgi:hypothetical protein
MKKKYTSWLEATPTAFISQGNILALFQFNLWERHFAAINQHFNPQDNSAMCENAGGNTRWAFETSSN